MNALPVAVGGFAGLLLGWLAWLAAARFAARYRMSGEVPGGGAPDSDERPVPAPAALSLAGMTLWGGWVGAQAPGLPLAVSALVVTSLLLCIALVDLRVRRIPNELTLALLGWAVVQALWLGQPGWWSASVLGLVVAGGLFLLLYGLGRGALGLGDVKLEAALGALVGYPAVLAAMLAGVLAGGLAAAALLLARRAGRKDAFAYGPFLALGAWLVYTRLIGLWPG